jgi:hypothetical protein
LLFVRPAADTDIALDSHNTVGVEQAVSLTYYPHDFVPGSFYGGVRVSREQNNRRSVRKLLASLTFVLIWGREGTATVPNVVPALCIVYSTLLFFSRRWTAATSLETEAEGVPMGMRQKSDWIIACQFQHDSLCRYVDQDRVWFVLEDVHRRSIIHVCLGI